MKKDRTPEAVLDELLGLVPERRVTQVQSFLAADKRRERNDSGQDEQSLNLMAGKLRTQYFANANEEPRFCYIGHIKKDGVMAARALEKAMGKDSKQGAAVYAPQISEKDLSVHINKRRLREEAVESGLVEKKKTPVLQTLASVIAGFGVAVGTVASVLDIAQVLDESVLRGSIFGSLGLWFYLTLVLIFAASVYSLFAQRRKNNGEILADLKKVLNNSSDEQFGEFLARFSSGDILIPDCDKVKADSPVFICALQTYNYRQKLILHAFWSELAKKQLWFIFMEESQNNIDLMMGASKAKREVRLYRLKPLSKHEKRSIAARTYTDQVRIRPEEDEGIKKHGVDYVCRFRLREREPVADAEHIHDKIREFCTEYKSCYQADIKLIIRLVAELSSNYYIDFSSRRGWEHLFDYHNEDAETAALDKEITARLQLDNYTIKNLIPEIWHSFGDYIEEIVTGFQNTELTSECKQWCLLKALRCRADKRDDRYLAIADTLMGEWQYSDDVGSSVWIGILIKTLQVFYADQVFWFLPSVVHNLLRIGDDRRAGGSQNVFSRAVVLDVARMNLLLNINTAGDSEKDQRIDLIRDHCRVTENAARERNPQFRPESNQGFPSSFGLLQLTNQERQRYYNTLVFLKEQEVLDYYGYIFDMYCASLLLANGDIRFCYKELYDNTLYNKYAKKDRIASATSETYIQIILGLMLDLLDNLYGDSFGTIREAIEELREILNDETTGDDAQKILFLLAKFDVIGAVTLNFIACMIARLDDSETIPNDVYLGLGNYLIGMTFLTYHENTQDSFYNHDFIHLIRMHTNYTHPSGAVLGYLYFCDTVYKSKFSSESIRHYISMHKEAYLNSLQQIAGDIRSADLEDFICFVHCVTGLNQEEKLPIYIALRETILSQYAAGEKSEVLVELLTLLIDRRSTDLFLKDTPENNVEKILTLSANLVHIIYVRYLICYQDKYLELCHLVAEKILDCAITSRLHPVIQYAQFSKRKESEEYRQTVRKLYRYLKESKLYFEIYTLERCVLFLLMCHNNKRDGVEAFQWVNEQEITELIQRVHGRKDNLLAIQAKEYLAPRVWNKYGLLFFLRYLMTSSIFVAQAAEQAYITLDEAAKTEYIMANCSKLPPTLNIDADAKFNIAYIDMLTAFINKGELQKQMDERAFLRKLADDAITVIDSLRGVGQLTLRDMRNLVREYVNMIDRE